MPRYYQNPETGRWDLTQEEWEKLQAESKHNEDFDFGFALMGNGYPSKKIDMQNRQRKALQKNPNHTTMKDYKFSNPNSIPSKALERNKKKLRKSGIEIEKQVTDKS